MLPLLLFLSLRSTTVIDLSKDTFFDFTSRENFISIVHFYGINCPACVDSEDVFDELSRMYWQEKRIRFGQLDCDRYSDLCDSIGAVDRPAWLAWLPGQTHSKRYNRNYNTEQFERWIRQQTGIWPTARQGNLLYINKTDIDLLRKKPMCMFTIIDQPRNDESQLLHASARDLEKKVKRGVRFVAISKEDSGEIGSKLLQNENFGAFLHSKGSWVKYTGQNDSEEILKFLKEKKCNVIVAKPTPSPTPMEELEDIPDDEYIPYEENEQNNHENNDDEITRKRQNDDADDEEDNEISEWSDDNDEI